MTELATRTKGLAIKSLTDLQQLGEMFAQSGFFKDTKDAAQCGIKILAGLELGFSPFESMTGIHLIQGKPALGAGLMAAAVKRSGRYDYRVTTMTDDLVEIQFFQDGDAIGVSAFSAADAKKAGTQNLTKFPRNMLFARAMSNGVKWYCPDVFTTPVYTPAELGAVVDEDGDVIDVEARPTDGEPEPEAEGMIDGKDERLSSERAAAMHKELGKLGIDSGEHKRFATAVLGRKVESFTDLLDSEALEVWNTAKKSLAGPPA